MTARRDLILKISLGLVWLICLYRAITQSIVHDEALTYGLYIQAPFSQIFQFFDANHHFLNTLLMRLSVAVFGLSEWSLRLPALAGAALYFAAVYRLCTREFRAAAASYAAAALLSLNPFILDFMVAARGYGMALGLWMWAFAILVAYVRKPYPSAMRSLLEAGTALGLSIMANLVFAIPALALTVAAWSSLKAGKPTAAPAPEPQPTSKKRQRRRRRPAPTAHDLALQSFWRWVVIPAIVGCAILFVVSPISKATSGDFYAGAESIAGSLRSLYDITLAHGGPLRPAAIAPTVRDAVSFGVAPLIFLAALAVGIQRRRPILILSAGVAVACGVLLFVLHLAVNLRYPLDRTGIYFAALIAIALAALADEPGALSLGAIAVSAVLTALFVVQFDTHKFAVWEYDADTPAILKELSKAVPDKRPDSVHLANSWQLEPALSFYAMKDNLTWLQPITRDPIAPGANFYVLMPMDRGAVEALHLKTLYTGPHSGTILAAPQN